MEILIAKDDPISGKLLGKVIESMGHQVLLAKDGLEAWEIIQKKKIKMLITDWMMPGMDGMELCRRIRAAKFPYYFYIIFLTAQSHSKDAIDALKAGADDYIAKPFDPEELVARIRTGLRVIKLEENSKETQLQLLQSDKMASIGRLAAGVAHEINNPTGFVNSNLRTLADYAHSLVRLINEYQNMVKEMRSVVSGENAPAGTSVTLQKITDIEAEIDIRYILEDITALIRESQEGMGRIKKIVQDLKDFAHPGEQELKLVNVNQCLDSTLNVVWNELKYKAKIVKEYGEVSLLACYPQKLNQVFMNLLVNAAQAIPKQGEIKIRTRNVDGRIEIEISDNGVGIPAENLGKLFTPFFTTKEVGQGTGLGLNVSYNIIKEHNGSIGVQSEPGKGSTFTIRIPIKVKEEDLPAQTEAANAYAHAAESKGME
jgi:signal transduction histidine kinase